MQRVEEECPFRDICPHHWYDFTSSGTNGDNMDQDCPMRVAIRSGVYDRNLTSNFIKGILPGEKGKF